MVIIKCLIKNLLGDNEENQGIVANGEGGQGMERGQKNFETKIDCFVIYGAFSFIFNSTDLRYSRAGQWQPIPIIRFLSRESIQ